MEKGNEYPRAVEERLHLFADQDREANADDSSPVLLDGISVEEIPFVCT